MRVDSIDFGHADDDGGAGTENCGRTGRVVFAVRTDFVAFGNRAHDRGVL